jgi:16S rRNA C967 or C1407 C5-methylase (RsmB/RsmF family)
MYNMPMSDPLWKNLPEKFLETFFQLVPKKLQEDTLEGYCIRRPTTFRTNLLKISNEDLKILLQKQNITYHIVPWFKDAFILMSPTKKELIETDIYKNGLIYIQSLSSMIPPLILDPKPEQKICDLTAAPGSKTSQMAAMMTNTGEIIANDLSKVRLFKLKYNLNLLGVKIPK